MSLTQMMLEVLGGSPLSCLREAWASLLVFACQRVFRGFLQDLFLSLPWVQEGVLRALRTRGYREVVTQALQAPPPGASFASLEYYVDAAAAQTLQFAALAALSTHLQSEEVLAPAQLLPQVSRVLLQTEEPQAGRFLEAVAAALASQMSAGLLLVDGMLLATLAGTTFGRPPEAYLAAFSGAGAAASSPLTARDAARLRLAWRALREVLYDLERPTVVYVRNVEALLCSSHEAHQAFMGAFASQEMALEGAPSRAPLVLVAGVSVNESAAARAGVRPQRQLQPGLAAAGLGSGSEEEEEEEEDGSLRPKPGRGGGSSELLGLEDELGLGDLLRSLSQLARDSQRPNARKLLLRLFPTRVKLAPPPAGPAAARHQQRMQRDAAEEAEEENYRVAAAVAASTGVSIPPKASGIYGGSPGARLSRGDWGKVLSWAVAMQTLQAKQQLLQEEEEQEEEEEREREQAAALLCPAEAAADEAAPSLAGNRGSSRGPRQEAALAPGAGLRQRRLAPSLGAGATAAGEEAEAAAGAARRADSSRRLRSAPGGASARPTLAASLWQGLWQAVSPLRLAASAAALPWRLAQAASGAARTALYRLPLVGGPLEGLLEGRLDAAQLEAELRELEAQLAQLERLRGAAASSGAASVDGGGGGGGGGGSGALLLSGTAVRYGLGMLQRSSGGVKQRIEPANSYERALLAEVLSPEDCGRGFSEVGALGEAKAALREAVQLPLQHPHLFTGGALARPSKGVLLFGPPGTGKTLVARAAAAECGAAFLALNPSAVASKWFGDSVKFIRAAFTLAAKLSPAVIFIDEVDALLGRRSSLKEHEALREMKNELMQQWDGIRAGRGRVVVLGATNRPFDLDEAVLRRFTHRVFIGLPDRAARAAILGVVLEGERLAADVDVVRLAERTEGYSGSDLRQLCIQAAMRPVRTFLERGGGGSDKAEAVAAEAGAGSAAGAACQEAEEEGVAAGESGTQDSMQLTRHGGATANGGEAGSAASAAHSRSASLASSAGMEQQPEVALAPGSSSSAGGSAAAASLRMVPRLGSLLREAESIARLPANPKTELRPTSMQDFEDALREVSPSVDPESGTIQELNEWNKQYGTSANKAGVRSRRLSYYS